VCGGQPSPHKPRLVVSHSRCPPLSSSPPSAQLCNRYCSNKQQHKQQQLCTRSCSNKHTQHTHTIHSPTVPPSPHPREQLYNRYCSNKHPPTRVYSFCARSLSRSRSPPPPSFTQYPSPPRSLKRDGQTSPHRPRLVVSRSTCPPLSPSPHANSFIIGTAVINTHGIRFSFGRRGLPRAG